MQKNDIERAATLSVDHTRMLRELSTLLAPAVGAWSESRSVESDVRGEKLLPCTRNDQTLSAKPSVPAEQRVIVTPRPPSAWWPSRAWRVTLIRPTFFLGPLLLPHHKYRYISTNSALIKLGRYSSVITTDLEVA